jgi:hypothetical protein
MVLDTSVGATESELADILTPSLVVMGEADDDHGSGADLADIMPLAGYVEVPGNHMSAVTEPDFGAAIRDFLVR